MAKGKKSLAVDALTHREAKRRNIPTEEHKPVLSARDARPVPAIFARRDRDLDPQLVWRGKDEQSGEDLRVPSLPLYIQEKMHPKVLIDDLRRETKHRRALKQGFYGPPPLITWHSELCGFNVCQNGNQTTIY